MNRRMKYRSESSQAPTHRLAFATAKHLRGFAVCPTAPFQVELARREDEPGSPGAERDEIAASAD